MLDILNLGAGGSGREVYQCAKDSLPGNEYRLKGFLSSRPDDLDGFGIQERVLGDDASYAVQENDRFVFAIGNIEAKKHSVERMKARGIKCLTLIHPTAVVASSSVVVEGL